MSTITIKQVTKAFGDVVVLKEFNEVFQDKEFITLLGPSGCGKTTMLRMIAGFEKPTSGEISIDGRVVSSEKTFVPPEKRDIGMVFQSYAVWPHMTVFDNVAYPLKIKKLDKATIKQKVDWILEAVHLSQYAQRIPSQLSGGQQQRVALGRALVAEPKLLLLDEPLSNLDAKLRTAMRAEISRLHKRLATTFVYVTHDQTEAMTMGDRIVVMKDGIIQQNDAPQVLYDTPCNLFVAGFIGSPQMNFLDAVITAKGSGYTAKLPGGEEVALPARMNKEVLGAYEGKTVVLGIRPEDVEAVTAGEPHDLDARIEIAELMGAEINLHLDYKGVRIVARTGSTYPGREGATGSLRFKQDKIHLFDKETEKAIAH